MTYITENIIAMGFPAGDLSSGLFGFLEVKRFTWFAIEFHVQVHFLVLWT